METLTNTINFESGKSNQIVTPNILARPIDIMRQNNLRSLEYLETLKFNACKFIMQPKTINNCRAIRISVIGQDCWGKHHCTLVVNQEILEHVYAIANTRTPAKIELTGEEDYEAAQGEDFGFTLFKMEVENKKWVIFDDDFISAKGEAYMKATIWHPRCAVNYYIKRTPELEQYLIDSGLVLTRSFNKEQES